MNRVMKKLINIVWEIEYQLKIDQIWLKTNDKGHLHFVAVEPIRNIIYNCNTTCEPESIKQSKTRNKAISASIKICLVK